MPKSFGIRSVTMRMIRQRMVRPIVKQQREDMEVQWLPELFKDEARVQEKIAYLENLQTVGKLRDPQFRMQELPDLVRCATHQEADVWKPAFDLMLKFFRSELDQITGEFTKEIRESKKPLEYEYRLFVARSPYGEKSILMQMLHDVRVKWVALNSLLERPRLHMHDLYGLPLDIVESIASHPATEPPLRKALIYSDFMAGQVAERALKTFLEEGNKPEAIRQEIFARYVAGSFVPQSVVLYAVRHLNPSKKEILSLLGLSGQGRQPSRKLTEDKAAEIARRIVAFYKKEEGLAREMEEEEECIVEISEAIGKNLGRQEREILLKAIEAEGRRAGIPESVLADKSGKYWSPVIILNPPRSIADYFVSGTQGKRQYLVEKVADHLIEKDLLEPEDLNDLAILQYPAARYILARHPRTRVKNLLLIMMKKGHLAHLAFDNLSRNIGRHPMLTWPELISWAIRSQNPYIRVEALRRPEVLIEQLLSQLDISKMTMAREVESEIKKGKKPALSGGGLVESMWPTVHEAALKGLLQKLPDKIVGFTRLLMAIEAEDAGALGKALALHPMRHSAEPFTKKELEMEKVSAVEYSLEELVAGIKDPLSKLDIRQKIALLCDENDAVALQAWLHLTDPGNLKKVALLSKRSVITWSLHSRSLALKQKVVSEPEIIVEQLLAMLSYTLNELKSEKNEARRAQLEGLQTATVEALKEKIAQKVSGFIRTLPAIHQEVIKARIFGFDHAAPIEDGVKAMALLAPEVGSFLAQKRSKPLTDIYLWLMKFFKGYKDLSARDPQPPVFI